MISAVGITHGVWQVVAGEKHPVRDPVVAAEDPAHPRQQQAAEEELLAEHGVEGGEEDDHGEPSPGAAEEAFAGVGAEELGEAPRRWGGDPRQDEPETEDRHEGEDPEPDAATGAAARGVARRPQPERRRGAAAMRRVPSSRREGP